MAWGVTVKMNRPIEKVAFGYTRTQPDTSRSDCCCTTLLSETDGCAETYKTSPSAKPRHSVSITHHQGAVRSGVRGCAWCVVCVVFVVYVVYVVCGVWCVWYVNV